MKITTESGTFQVYYQRLKHLMGMWHKLRKEENEIGMELLELQVILIPQIESLQKHIHKAKGLVNTPDISSMDSMIGLAVELLRKLWC